MRPAVLLLVALSWCLPSQVCGCKHGPGLAGPKAANARSELASLCGMRFGNEDARVRVIAFLPVRSGCQDYAGLYLISLARAHPTMISVQVFDMQSDEGQRGLEERGLHCASVLVNGTTQFDLGERGGKVLFEGRVDSHYRLSDLREALARELKAAYGEGAPDLPPTPPAGES